MMFKDNTNGRNQFAMLTIDDLVPQDHLVQKIDVVLDFEPIYSIVEVTYSGLGRPNIDPVILIKSVFIQYLSDIRSIRRIIKEIDTNVAYHQLLDHSLEGKIPRFSTFGKSYVRQFRKTMVSEDIFACTLEQVVKAGSVTKDSLYLGSIHIKVNVSKHKFTKETTYDGTKVYQDELGDEANRQRIEAGKRPFTLDLGREVKLRERKISKAGLESGHYAKGEREKQFAYSAYTPYGDNGSILSIVITPGNIHDSQITFQFVKQSKKLFPETNCIVADAGYKTPKFVHSLTHLNLRPRLLYSRPKGKKGLSLKNEFLYDEYFDRYIYPQDQMLASSTVTRKGHRGHKSNPKEYVDCSPPDQCTINKNHQRVIMRHVWGGPMGEVEHLRLTDLNKSAYKKREQAAERTFADAKKKYGTRRIKYRDLEKVVTHMTLVLAAMSLKRLVTWLWKGKESSLFCSRTRNEVGKKLSQARIADLRQLLSTV